MNLTMNEGEISQTKLQISGSNNSMSRTKRTPFITKNAQLIRRAAEHNGSTGANYHYNDKL